MSREILFDLQIVFLIETTRIGSISMILGCPLRLHSKARAAAPAKTGKLFISKNLRSTGESFSRAAADDPVPALSQMVRAARP